MLKQRIISACIGIPVLLLFAWLGQNWWALLLAVLIGIGLNEYDQLCAKRNISLSLPVLLLGGLFVVGLLFYLSHSNILMPGVFLVLGCAWAVIFLFMAHKFYQEQTMSTAFATVFGIIYIACGMGILILLRDIEPNGFWLLLLCLIITWATDSGAYFIGRFMGKHKLAPTVSPNKTIEGAMGGVLVAFIAVMIYNYYILHWQTVFVLFFAMITSCLGQLGDLMESWLKRWAGVKDSGKFLPGHGGLLDRFDSMIFVAPWVYFAALLLKLL